MVCTQRKGRGAKGHMFTYKGEGVLASVYICSTPAAICLSAMIVS